jgi:hypothetical protein
MYYVMYENSLERLISPSLKSIADCNNFIMKAKIIDMCSDKTYHYSILQDVTNI